MNYPLVSVIMSNYNYEKFINYAINSVISQTFKDFELVIVDDASTDNSHEIIEKWKYQDNRIKTIFHKKNEGIAKTFNDGIEIARGKYILIMASDDMLKPNTLETCINVLNKYQCGVTIFEAEVIDAKNQSVNIKFSQLHRKPALIYGNFFEELLKGNFIMTGMVKKEIIENYNIKFDTRLKHLNDWLFWLDLAYVTNFYYIQQPLYYYRRHKSNASYDVEGYKKDYEIIYDIIESKYNLEKNNKYKSAFYRSKALNLYGVIKKDYKNLRRYLLKSIYADPLKLENFELIIRGTLIHFPILYKFTAKIYRFIKHSRF